MDQLKDREIRMLGSTARANNFFVIVDSGGNLQPVFAKGVLHAPARLSLPGRGWRLQGPSQQGLFNGGQR